MAEFEPRSGKRDSLEEITYTGTDDVPWEPGDDIPPGATIVDLTTDEGVDDEGNPKPRQRFARIEGVQKTLKADASGLFHPKSQEDENALLAFGLPVSRESKAAEPKKEEPAGGKKGEG